MAGEPETAVDAAIAAWGDARERVARFGDWLRRLTDEVSQLPDTMQRLRHGAANFELTGERLAKSSASLEEIADLYQSTIAESGRRSAQAVDALRAQVDALAEAAGSPDRIVAAMTDVQRAFDTIADLNPFWPRSKDSR